MMATESTESTEILKKFHVGCAVRTGVMATESHGNTRKECKFTRIIRTEHPACYA